MIKVEEIFVLYEETTVLRDVSIEIDEGETVAVIGSNGSGKTTLLKAIAGMVRPGKGKILFNGIGIERLPTHKIVKLGIIYVPAERELFPLMSVMENLELGAYGNKEWRKQLNIVFRLFPRLEERMKQHAGTLSGGEQQMLAIARGLMAKPKVLLLDEPSSGLAPILVDELYRQLYQLKQEGLTMLLAEQQVPIALSLADRAYVLENGRIRISGKSQDLLEEPKIKRAYLGVT